MVRSLPLRSNPREEAATQHAGTREAKSRVAWSSQIGPWLSNPLLVTVVAALLGSWLLPQITRQWQDHQKALEIQTGLVSDMSSAVSSAVATSRFVAGGLLAGPGEQQAWNDAYREWTTTSSSIGAKLRAYAGPKVGSDWQSFTYVVTDYVLLSTNPRQSSGRVAQVAEIYGYRDRLPGAHLSRSEWTTLAATRSGPVFQNAYAALGRGLLARQDELVQRVLESHVSGF